MTMIATLLIAAAAQAATPTAIEGRWINPSRDVIIAIAPCGEAQCGTVEWASEQARADARKGVAELIGAALLTGLKPNGPERWRGRLFIPDRKMRVNAKITLLGESQIKVSGCALGGMLCDSQVWTRSTGAPSAGQ